MDRRHQNILPSVKPLMGELENVPPGPIQGQDKNNVIALLAKCWQDLRGADETSMEGWKLNRAEKLSWDPPILSFTIERHGQTLDGSGRADLHHWEVDLHQGTADCMPAGHRQLTPIAKNST
jgi:hypothetical protein